MQILNHLPEFGFLQADGNISLQANTALIGSFAGDETQIDDRVLGVFPTTDLDVTGIGIAVRVYGTVEIDGFEIHGAGGTTFGGTVRGTNLPTPPMFDAGRIGSRPPIRRARA